MSKAARRGVNPSFLAASAVLPALLTTYLAFNRGGFFPITTGLVASEMALLLAGRLVLCKKPLQGLGKPLILVAVALLGLALWTLGSSSWSHAPARAADEHTRVVLYALVLVFFGLLPFSIRRLRWMVWGLAAAITLVCAVALVARTHPEIIDAGSSIDRGRLGYPLTYWNALGLFAGIGAVFCTHLTCSAREPWPVRTLAAASMPVLAATIYFTFSRGGAWVTVGGIALYLLIGRPRAWLTGALACVPPIVAALAVAVRAGALVEGPSDSRAAMAAGHRVGLAVLGATLAAVLLRGLLGGFDRKLARLRLPARVRRFTLTGGAALACALALAGAAAVDLPSVMTSKYEQFVAGGPVGPKLGASRLLDAGDNGRIYQWNVALSAFGRSEAHGRGAGTYGLLWTHERKTDATIQDAHSLYAEVLGELGVPGLMLLLLALGTLLGGFAWRTRGPERPMFAALLAAGLAWAVHAGVEWDWEMPAVTLWLFALGGGAIASRSWKPTGPRRAAVAARALGVAACVLVAAIPARVALAESRLGRGVDALYEGHCDTARHYARLALDVAGARPAPHRLRAFCDMRQGDYRRARADMGAAVALDPDNWEDRYGDAVARAAAGLDPRTEMRRAIKLNPLEPLVQTGRKTLLTDKSTRWKTAGRKAALPVPILR